jgi:putative transposase
MPKRTFTEEQIASALRQAEAGTPAAEICRKLAITEQSVYLPSSVRPGIGSMSASQVRRPRQVGPLPVLATLSNRPEPTGACAPAYRS